MPHADLSDVEKPVVNLKDMVTMYIIYHKGSKCLVLYIKNNIEQVVICCEVTY